MQRIFFWLHTEVKGVQNAALLLALFTFFAQIMALIRDRLLAHTFGAGEVLDIFYASFRVPDMLYVFIASMVSVFVLIPFLYEAEEEGKKKVTELLSTTLTFFGGLLILGAFLIAFFSETIVSFLYSGFSLEQQKQTVLFIQILLVQPVLLGISGIFGAYVQRHGRFLVYSLAPILYTVGIIVGILFLYPLYGDIGIVWGVVLGAFLHLFVHIPFIVSEKVFPRVCMPKWDLVFRIMRISLPRSFTLASSQFSMLALISLGTFFTSGSITVFMFAYNLQSVPLSLIAVSFSVASFPALTSLYKKNDTQAFVTLLQRTIRHILLLSLFATVLFIVLRAHIVRILLGSGAFDWDATLLTGALLALFVFSLLAQGLSMLFVRSMYAMGKTLIPLLSGILQFILTVSVSYTLFLLLKKYPLFVTFSSELLRVRDSESIFVLSLAFGYSIGAYGALFFLMFFMQRIYPSLFPSLFIPFLQMFFSALFGGGGAWLGLHFMNYFVELDTFLSVMIQSSFAFLLGLFFWIGALFLLKNKDLYSFFVFLKKKKE